MPCCHEMKKRHVYKCKNCGIEIKVIKECEKSDNGKCICGKDEDSCHFICCGEKLIKK